MIEKMKMQTEDNRLKNIDKLEKIFPNCITEITDDMGCCVKSVDIEMLKKLLCINNLGGGVPKHTSLLG